MLKLGATLLAMTVILEPGRTFNLVVINALRATGDARYPVMAGAASMVLVLGGASGCWASTSAWGWWVCFWPTRWTNGFAAS